MESLLWKTNVVSYVLEVRVEISEGLLFLFVNGPQNFPDVMADFVSLMNLF